MCKFYQTLLTLINHTINPSTVTEYLAYAVSYEREAMNMGRTYCISFIYCPFFVKKISWVLHTIFWRFIFYINENFSCIPDQCDLLHHINFTVKLSTIAWVIIHKKVKQTVFRWYSRPSSNTYIRPPSLWTSFTAWRSFNSLYTKSRKLIHCHMQTLYCVSLYLNNDKIVSVWN
jgi:hypothetical protein